MTPTRHLGRGLVRLRGARGWKQRELAEAAGVTKAMLSNWERGHTLPRLESLEKVLVALGADLRALQAAMEAVASEGEERRALPPEPPPADAPRPEAAQLLAQASLLLSGLAELVHQAAEQGRGPLR